MNTHNNHNYKYSTEISEISLISI